MGHAGQARQDSFGVLAGQEAPVSAVDLTNCNTQGFEALGRTCECLPGRALTSRNDSDVKLWFTTCRFLGNLVEINNNVHRVPDWLYECALKANGKVWSYSMPGATFVHLTHPQEVETMMRAEFDNFEKVRIRPFDLA